MHVVMFAHASKKSPPATKSDARLYTVLRLSRKNHLRKSKALHLGNVTPLTKSAPRSPNMSDGTRNASLQILFKRFTPSSLFATAARPLTFKSAPAFSTAQLPKVVRSWGVFNILTSKCALRHSRLHFLSTTTSKRSDLELRCFCYSDFEACLAPQLRALFQQLNFQKCSENGVFLPFWLRTRFVAQPLFEQHNFQKCSGTEVSQHFDFGACFARFAPQPRATFDLSSLRIALHPPLLLGPQSGGKNAYNVSRLFSHFDLLSTYPLFSDSSHNCCCICPYIGSLTSKLPSVSVNYHHFCFISVILTIMMMTVMSTTIMRMRMMRMMRMMNIMIVWGLSNIFP